MTTICSKQNSNLSKAVIVMCLVLTSFKSVSKPLVTAMYGMKYATMEQGGADPTYYATAVTTTTTILAVDETFTQEHISKVTSNTTNTSTHQHEEEEGELWLQPTNNRTETQEDTSILPPEGGNHLIPPINASSRLTSCEWHNDLSSDCYSIIYPATVDTSNWYFIGDSTMARPFNRLTGIGQFIKIKSDGGRPRKLGYYGFREEVPWVPANVSLGEGPKQNATGFRTGCVSCSSSLYDVPSNNSDHHRTAVEFLAVEYARDVEFPTNHSKTTQETVSLYRTNKGWPRNQTSCLVTAGMHDMSLPNITTELFVHNCLEHMRLLNQHCKTIIWLGMNSVGYTVRHPQQNSIIEEWNTALQRSLPSGAFFLDVYNYSLHVPHGDNIHMNGPDFYDPLAAFWWSLMQKDENRTNDGT